MPLKEDDPYGPWKPRYSLTTCPVSYITEDTVAVIELFQLFQTFRVLPESGGLLDQQARLMEMLHVVATEFDRVKSHDLLESSRPKQESVSSPRPRR